MFKSYRNAEKNNGLRIFGKQFFGRFFFRFWRYAVTALSVRLDAAHESGNPDKERMAFMLAASNSSALPDFGIFPLSEDFQG